jgi:hypothetical protein
MLALHRLQDAMVYINTLMIQRVLSKERRMQQMGNDQRPVGTYATYLQSCQPVWHFF